MHCTNSDGVGQSNRIQLYNDAKFMLRFKISEHKITWSKKVVTLTSHFHPLRFLHPWTLALISGFLFITSIQKTEPMLCLTKFFLMLLVTSENFWNVTFFGKTLCLCQIFFILETFKNISNALVFPCPPWRVRYTEKLIVLLHDTSEVVSFYLFKFLSTSFSLSQFHYKFTLKLRFITGETWPFPLE